MDTRSVMRSRRRSTRLIGQPPQDERVKRPTAGKRRHSDHNTSGRTSSNASREGSCPQMGSTSKTPSRHDARPATPTSNATGAVAKTEDRDTVLPMFPNLRSSKSKASQSHGAEVDSITVPHEEPAKHASESAVKGHVSMKWVKTARGSIRLASDSPAGNTKNNADEKSSEGEEGNRASSATARRQSRRLASMTPDVAGETVEVKPVTSRATSSKTRTIANTICAADTAGSDAEQESEPDSQDHPTRAASEHNGITHLTHHEELPIQDQETNRLVQNPDTLQNTSPIPELVADIEKIILSSPVGGRKSANHGSKHTLALTPAEALKKRAPAGMETSSRTLRSSSRALDNASKSGKRLGSENADSQSSQLDGAYDDSIRGRRKKKTRAAGDTANTSKPSEPRGTKRGMELSQDEGDADTPGPRQRRRPNRGGPKPEVDLSSTNPIETATSRDAFSVDDPRVENPLSIGEFARRSNEPANPVMLAQMISSRNPEAADSDIGSSAAVDGSQEADQSRSPEDEAHKCEDCGRSPERYLVCAKCQEAVYCGKYCQIWNWPSHKSSCRASGEADQAEIELQEAYLGEMWAAALRVLREEEMAGGTLESLLLGEAVQHSPARPTFMGQGSSHGFVGLDLDASQPAGHDPQSIERSRAMSMRLAQATLGGDE